MQRLWLLLLFCSPLCFGSSGCGDDGYDDRLDDPPRRIEDNNHFNPGPGHTPFNNADVESGSVRIVRYSLSIAEGQRLYTYLAHLAGRSINDVPLNVVDNVVLHNDSGTKQTVFVKAVLQGYSQEAMQRVDLGPRETRTIAAMNPPLDFDALYAVTSAVSTNFQLAVFEGERLVDLDTRPLHIEPVNRVTWFWESDGEYADMRAFAVTLVTPEDRGNEIQRLLTEAARYSQHGAIIGYQGNSPESTIDQARAVYYALQDRGMVYTNVPGSFFDGAQYVKLPAQSLTTNSANCIDGTLVFASAFEAMGMDPFIVYMSGHALIGLRIMPDSTEPGNTLYIETTMVSHATFADAVEAAGNLVNERIAAGDPLLAMFDVKLLRRLGVTPINR